MEKKFDLSSLLKACNYSACRIGVTKIGESCEDDMYEVEQESEPELYEMLFLPDNDGVEHIRANYCHVEWKFFDKDGKGQIIYQLRIEYDVEEDSLHFHYDRFNLKTKYTLINILKSQSEWHHIGIAMYDNETEDIVADSWFDEYDTEDDTWIHAFEDLCDECEVNSRHASLFKGQEEEDGKTVDILDIVIDTETYKLDDEEDDDDDDFEEDDTEANNCSVEEDVDGNLIFNVNGVEFKMIKVEAGTFMMGAAANQLEDANEERELPVHQVTISNDYYIAETPVTWELWGEVMDEGYCEESEQEPIWAFGWYETYKFIHRLNRITGKQFRLPTEAEWEFAARGGNKSKGYKYSGSDNVDEVAWYDGNSHDNRNPNPEANTHPVKLKKPNELGLYDMSGNMWEQCHDGYAEYSVEAQINPVGDPDSELKVLRGGCHASSDKSCRISHRFFIEAECDDDNLDIYNNTTYRLVLSPFMPEDIPTSFNGEGDTDDIDDDELTIESREEMVGVPLAGIPFCDFDLKITPEEAEKLDGEIEVAFYTGGPYFASRNAAVQWKGALDVDNLTLNLYTPLYEYHDALYRLWEKKDYDHNFEDFVIEVFDMKITKGKVAILIELGS